MFIALAVVAVAFTVATVLACQISKEIPPPSFP
jgi:hypothetical protein